MSDDTAPTDNWPSAVVGDLADEYGTTVFTIRDYGSRAKGTHGPSSDLDAMVLFTQPPEVHKYGQLRHSDDPDGYTDAIDREMHGVDVQAWSLTKFGELLADSNPTAIEFLNSPITYWTAHSEGKVADRMAELQRYANRQFNPVRLYFHYRHMARDNYNQYLKNGNRTTVKKNLTVVRAVLYARHIRRTHEFPGMDFEAFLDDHVADDMAERAHDLLEAKRQRGGDQYLGNPFKPFVEAELDHDPDEDALNRRGIDEARVEEFMRDIDALVL